MLFRSCDIRVPFVLSIYYHYSSTSFVSSKLQQRQRTRFDMLSHSIRSFNLLSLRLGKPNCDIRIRFMVRFGSSYIFDEIRLVRGTGYDP